MPPKDSELHAPGTPVRLQVMENGATLVELIGGVRRHFQPGEVFDHPAPARAKQLLELSPAIVRKSNLPTKAELAKKASVEATARKLMQDKLVKEAEAKAKEIQEKLDKVEAQLRKMTPEVLKAEVGKRGLKDVAENVEAMVEAVLNDEKARMEA